MQPLLAVILAFGFAVSMPSELREGRQRVAAPSGTAAHRFASGGRQHQILNADHERLYRLSHQRTGEGAYGSANRSGGKGKLRCLPRQR